MSVEDGALFDFGPSHTENWPDRPRYLMSFAYVDDDQVAVAVKNDVDLIVDSGAFTTAASGKEMDHDAYLDWLLANTDAIRFALSLDVIGDHKQSEANHEHGLAKVGDAIHLVPTFHLGSPMTELERLCRRNDLVSIGGAVPFARQHRHLFNTLKQIHRVAEEHGTKLHGLGMTGSSIIHGFPWASVDSSGWTTPIRFPSFPLANENGKVDAFEHGWHLSTEAKRLVTAYGGVPNVVGTPGWSLKDVVGQETALRRREWTCTATARAYMYVEAAKNAHTPETPIRIYLSGHTGNLLDGTIGLISRAHAMGNPWVGRPTIHPAFEDPEPEDTQEELF